MMKSITPHPEDRGSNTKRHEIESRIQRQLHTTSRSRSRSRSRSPVSTNDVNYESGRRRGAPLPPQSSYHSNSTVRGRLPPNKPSRPLSSSSSSFTFKAPPKHNGPALQIEDFDSRDFAKGGKYENDEKAKDRAWEQSRWFVTKTKPEVVYEPYKLTRRQERVVEKRERNVKALLNGV